MILETILALTPLDYDHLARAVQVETARGTMDEYCVAVSILNRVRSPKYPNTVANVVYSLDSMKVSDTGDLSQSNP